MGKKSRKTTTKNQSNVPTNSGGSKKHDTTDFGGGIYADYVLAFRVFLQLIAPNISYSASVLDLLEVVETFASSYPGKDDGRSATAEATEAIALNPRSILPKAYEKLTVCFKIQRLLYDDGFVDQQRVQHLTLLDQLVFLLAPLVCVCSYVERSNKTKRPTSPTTVADHENKINHSCASAHCNKKPKSTLDVHQSKPPGRKKPESTEVRMRLRRDCKFTIGDLCYGNECFRAASLIKTATIFSKSVESRWDSIKQGITTCREANKASPLFPVMLASLETQQTVKQVDLLEQDWVRSFPQYHYHKISSFATIIAVAAFDQFIQFLTVKHSIDKYDAVRNIASLVQAIVDEPHVPTVAIRYPPTDLKSDAVLKVIKDLTRRGIPRSDVKTFVTTIIHRVRSVAAPYLSSVSSETALLHTHFLVAKMFVNIGTSNTTPGIMVDGTMEVWNERGRQAPAIPTHMDMLAIGVILPDLILFLSQEEATQILPWNGLFSVKDRRVSFGFTFAVHCILLSIWKIQGDDDVKSIATASKVYFTKWCNTNDKDVCLMGKARDHEISLWNPFVAGLWLARLVSMSHAPNPGPAAFDDAKNIEMTVRLYDFFRHKLKTTTVPILDALCSTKCKLSIAKRRSHDGDVLFDGSPCLMPLSHFTQSASQWARERTWDQDYIVLDMPKTLSLVANFQRILRNFFVGHDESVVEWMETLMVEPDAAGFEQSTVDEVALCLIDFFTDNRASVQLFD